MIDGRCPKRWIEFGLPRPRRDVQGNPLRADMPVRVLELSSPTFTGVDPLQHARLTALQGRVVRIKRFDAIGFAEIELMYRDNPRDLRGCAWLQRSRCIRGSIVLQTWNLDPRDLLAVASV